MKTSAVLLPVALVTLMAVDVEAACPTNSNTPVTVGNGRGGHVILCGPVNPRVRVVGNPRQLVFVGVGGGGAGGSAGGSGFSASTRDNGGGGAGGAGAPILGFQVATRNNEIFEVVPGGGGAPAPSGGRMGTPGVVGGSGGNTIVRRINGTVAGPTLLTFPGGAGGAGGLGSTGQPNAAPGGAAATGGARGGNGGVENAAGENGAQSFVLQGTGCGSGAGSGVVGPTGGNGNGGGGGGGASSLCVGGNGGRGGTFAGSTDDARAGLPGTFGAGGGGAGARGEGGEAGLRGGAGGNGIVIVFWGTEASDFALATSSTSAVTMSAAAIARIRQAIDPVCGCAVP